MARAVAGVQPPSPLAFAVAATGGAAMAGDPAARAPGATPGAQAPPLDPASSAPDDAHGTGGDGSRAGAASDLAAELARSRADGFAAGLEAGRQAAEARLGGGIEDVARLAHALAQARAIDPDALVEPLLDALMAMLRTILEEEPRLARESLRPRALAALARVGDAARPGALLLHPRDMAWARAQIAAHLADEGVALVADDRVQPGSFRLRAGPATVEDGIADRLDRLAPEARALLSAALTGDLASDAGANDADGPASTAARVRSAG